jgi:hypothetical protein
MLSGVVAAQQVATPRGALLPPLYLDDSENIIGPFIAWAIGGAKLLRPGAVSDADVFYAPRRPQVLMAAFVADADGIRAPRLVQAQTLHPALYVAVDVIGLPAVALPGILQTHLLVGDDSIFASFISTHGSLRPALYNAFDAVFAPALGAAQTLRPNLHTSSDVFQAPTVRVGIRPLLVFDADVHYTSLIAGTVILATFDGIATEVALTNGNLTATHTTTSSATAGARSTSNKTTGKFYFEVTMSLTHNSNGDSVGLIASGGTYPDILNLSANCMVTEKGGNIFSNGGFAATFGSPAPVGTVLGVAVDLGTRKGWFRRGSGNWNNDAAQNPATGAGGVTVQATVAFAPVVALGGGSAAIGDSVTANFGQTAYANAAPAGFGNWTA